MGRQVAECIAAQVTNRCRVRAGESRERFCGSEAVTGMATTTFVYLLNQPLRVPAVTFISCNVRDNKRWKYNTIKFSKDQLSLCLFHCSAPLSLYLCQLEIVSRNSIAHLGRNSHLITVTINIKMTLNYRLRTQFSSKVSSHLLSSWYQTPASRNGRHSGTSSILCTFPPLKDALD